MILGYTEADKWVFGSYRIVVDKIRNEFRVFKQVRARPNGTIFEVGSNFNSKGLEISGIFNNGQLIHKLEFKSQESGFLDFSGKYTLNQDLMKIRCLCEHNANNKLHGRGI